MYSKTQASAGAPGQEFRTFEDMEVYRQAREFRKAMYGVTRRLPAYEKFELASQVRRAAVSLTNNIAEGHGRYHYPDQIKFQLQARGSLMELIDDLNICADENYLTPAEVETLKKQAVEVHKLINGYIRYLRDRKTGSALTLHDVPVTDPLGDEELDALLSETI
ncbi:MAG: four helix bundle protein [Verrucomicrobiae bacterium]|nr:four helix bundle protein [Verrucomicrobiae bacterium]